MLSVSAKKFAPGERHTSKPPPRDAHADGDGWMLVAIRLPYEGPPLNGTIDDSVEIKDAAAWLLVSPACALRPGFVLGLSDVSGTHRWCRADRTGKMWTTVPLFRPPRRSPGPRGDWLTSVSTTLNAAMGGSRPHVISAREPCTSLFRDISAPDLMCDWNDL